MFTCTDPLGNKVTLDRKTLFGHIYRRHKEMSGRVKEIRETIENPDIIAKSKKDGKSLLYFRLFKEPLLIMVVGTPQKGDIHIRTSFFVLNTYKGDPIIWQKKIST